MNNSFDKNDAPFLDDYFTISAAATPALVTPPQNYGGKKRIRSPDIDSLLRNIKQARNIRIMPQISTQTSAALLAASSIQQQGHHQPRQETTSPSGTLNNFFIPRGSTNRPQNHALPLVPPRTYEITDDAVTTTPTGATAMVIDSDTQDHHQIPSCQVGMA